MEIEKLEVIAVQVHDVGEASARLADLFGLEFKTLRPGVDYPIDVTLGEMDPANPLPGPQSPIAVDTKGFFELVERPNEPEGFRSLHFKVPDLEVAMAHMESRGVRLVLDVKAGGVRQAAYHLEDLYGIRVCLYQYDTSTLAEALSRE